MNQEPVKFLPHKILKPPAYPDSVYQQNWDLKTALDRSRDLSKTLIWIASLGWIIAAILLFNVIYRS